MFLERAGNGEVGGWVGGGVLSLLKHKAKQHNKNVSQIKRFSGYLSE